MSPSRMVHASTAARSPSPPWATPGVDLEAAKLRLFSKNKTQTSSRMVLILPTSTGTTSVVLSPETTSTSTVVKTIPSSSACPTSDVHSSPSPTRQSPIATAPTGRDWYPSPESPAIAGATRDGERDGDGVRRTVCFVAVRLGVSFAPTSRLRQESTSRPPSFAGSSAGISTFAQTNANTLIKPPTACWDFTAPTECWDFTVGWTETG
ncbi:hypothetical protein LTS10_009418 [Elasticomyces elasticus]|nr:hypothetical protein LTS10_009418 [Elasticomyces elasticus]